MSSERSELDRLLDSDPAVMPDAAAIWRSARERGAVPAQRPAGSVAGSQRGAGQRSGTPTCSATGGHYQGSQAEAVKARLDPDQLRAYHEVAAFESLFVSRSDGAAHARLRDIGKRAFTPRRIAMLGEAAQRYTDDLLAEVEGDELVDLVSSFSYVLPLLLIADLLGVSHADRELIHGWSSKIGRNRGGVDPAALMEAHAALGEFRAYIGEVIEHKRGGEPETDLVAALIDAEQEDRLTPDELAAMFIVLLFAGHETTTNLISIGLVELHRRPDEWQRLCADPSLAAAGVEELLRVASPVQYIFRLAEEARDDRGARGRGRGDGSGRARQRQPRSRGLP